MSVRTEAWADALAEEIRARLSLEAVAPFDVLAYADYLGVKVFEPADLAVAEDDEKYLLAVDRRSWQSISVRSPFGTAVVFNPSQSSTEVNATLAHALAHVQLRHVPSEQEVAAGVYFSSQYSETQEESADALSSALLLPRRAVAQLKNLGWSAAEISRVFAVSPDAARRRLKQL